MSSEETRFPEASFIKTQLFREPIYRADDARTWTALKNNLDDVRRFFWQVGQEVVFDEGEGYAFIRQIIGEDDQKVPHLLSSRPLNYETSLLLVLLRDELDRFETSGTDSVRLVRSRQQLRSLIEPYVRNSTDKARDRNRIDEAISRLVKLGFLRYERVTDAEEFQVMRIIKARFGAAELETVRERLLRYAQQEQPE